MNNDKWEPIDDYDPAKRKPREWAKIYNLELIGDIPNSLWSEYEWAYNLITRLKYYPLPDTSKDGTQLDSYENATLQELRAMELNRDLYMGADLGEKKVLEEKYIETQWVRQKLNFL